MKKILLASVATALLTGAASAADLPRRAAPPIFVPPPSFTWTGVYIGTHSAYTWTDKTRVTTVGNDPLAQFAIAAGVVPAAASLRSTDGFANIGGGFGINYQFTPGSGFVIGAGVDVDWTDIQKNTFVLGTPILPGLQTLNVYGQSLDYLATANGRIGYAFQNFLVYGTGGAAIGRVKYGHSVLIGPVLAAFGGDGGSQVGYNYGGGIEYAIPKDSFLGNLSLLKLAGIDIGGNVTLKAEYIHFDLGTTNVLVTDNIVGLVSANSRFKTEGNIVRAGFSYKFP